MARPIAEEEDEKPLDPAAENVRRKLVRFMIINLGLLFLALMVVIGELVYKARNAPVAGSPACSSTDALGNRRVLVDTNT